MADLPPHLLAPPPSETPQERYDRREQLAHLMRRRRRTAGLTFRQVAHAALMDPSRISRYEQGWQYPGPDAARRILDAIDRLERDGLGHVERAAQARLEYEAADAEAVGSAP